MPPGSVERVIETGAAVKRAGSVERAHEVRVSCRKLGTAEVSPKMGRSLEESHNRKITCFVPSAL